MLTFWLIIIRHSPVPVERDADLAFLRRFEFLAVQFDGIRMSIDDTVADAAVIHIQVRSTELRARNTYIQGSVDESPSGERSRSLDRPGAKTPRP